MLPVFFGSITATKTFDREDRSDGYVESLKKVLTSLLCADIKAQ